MNEREIFIGIVRNGKFYTLNSVPELSSPTSLTDIRMVESIPPDARQINLDEYEGKAIAVQGYNGGTWIYEAYVIDVGGPIVTKLVLNAFGNPPGF